MAGWGMGGWGMGWAASLLMVVLATALVGMVVAGAAVLVRAGNSRTSGAASSEPVLPLDERFARGEIDEEEYLRRRALLARSG